MIRFALCAVLAFGLPAAAAAQDGPGLGYGIAATSNYIFRGATQSDGPAVQGYVEGTTGTFYGGIWASTVDLDEDEVEVDLYLGIRPQFGDLTVDLSYTRYLYDESGDCCGEAGLFLGYPVGEVAEVGAGLYVDPENETTWAQASGAATVLGDYDLSGTVGSDFGTLDEDRDRVAWDFGVSRGLGSAGTVDLRYHDSTLDPARAVLSIGLDF